MSSVSVVMDILSGIRRLLLRKPYQDFGICCDGTLSRIWRLAVTETLSGVGCMQLRKPNQEFGIAVTETMSGVRRLLSRKLVRNLASAVTEPCQEFGVCCYWSEIPWPSSWKPC